MLCAGKCTEQGSSEHLKPEPDDYGIWQCNYLIEEVNIDSAEKAACRQNGQTLSGKELMEKGLSFTCKKRFDSASVYLKKIK